MSYSRAEFIKILAPSAVKVMGETNISAALTIAQGCLESRDGNSGLTQKGNNLFGIKGAGDAGTIYMPTREQRKDGSSYTINAPFAKFSSWAACIAARSKLLLNGVSWNRNIYKGVIGKRGKDAAYAIQAAGYATDLGYAKLLISIMDRYNLYQYDSVKQPPADKENEAVEIEFQVNSKKPVDAFLIGGKSYVPLRELATAIGVPFRWDNEKKQAYFNEKPLTSFHLDDDRVYVQLEPIGKAYGGQVSFDNKNKKAILLKEGK